MFKQLLQADAIGVCQIDACRVGGVNKNVDPVAIRDGSCMLPRRPGYSTEMRAASLTRYVYPGGAEWAPSLGIGAEVEEVAAGGLQLGVVKG